MLGVTEKKKFIRLVSIQFNVYNTIGKSVAERKKFKLQQSYWSLPRFSREFNPAAQDFWSGPGGKPRECRPLPWYFLKDTKNILKDTMVLLVQWHYAQKPWYFFIIYTINYSQDFI